MNDTQLLHQVIKSWDGGACLVDEQLNIQVYNETLRRWLGLENSQLQGKAFLDCFDQETPFTGNGRSKGVLRRKLESEIIVELFTMPLTDKDQIQYLLFMNDITDQQRMEKERKVLTHRLLEIQEEERKEISSLLHDQLGQLLTLIRLELQSIVPHDDSSKQHIESCTQHTLSLLESVRGLARSLRPIILDDMPIESALEDLVEEFDRSMEPSFTFKTEGQTSRTLDRDRQTSIYRILQETLQNAARHSGASHVDTVYTASRNGITLSVIDNGSGFSLSSPPPHESIGLIGIRERLARGGGFLKISSHAKEGSRLDAFMPYENN